MALIEAYDTRTGERLPYLVPEHFVGHPALGPHMSKTPRQKAADRQAAKSATPKAPASGSTDKEK